MKKYILLLVTLFLVLFMTTDTWGSIVNINDGAIHLIGNYQNNGIYLDYETVNEPGTHVDLVDNGSIEFLTAWNNSTLFMDGGSVESNLGARNSSSITIESGLIKGRLYVSDNATATVNGGIIGSFATSGNAVSVFNGGTINTFLSAVSNGTVTMNGGSVLGDVVALENGTVTITGGSINQHIEAAIGGIVYLKGTDFEINGKMLSYGDKLRDFAWYSDNYYTGTIKGVFSDGSVLNNEFKIYVDSADTSEIIIIPEPMTIFILGLGVLTIRMRRTA